jgi:hypothetical protein
VPYLLINRWGQGQSQVGVRELKKIEMPFKAEEKKKRRAN